ncbi:MAG: HEAT repeat domain-containing protein [Gemmataceae bacterium]|nr:HEAT repeat domain-containing protein [Gemmataceae bacterium]
MLDRGKLHKYVVALVRGNEATRRDVIAALRNHEEREWMEAPAGECNALVVALKQQLKAEAAQPLVLKNIAAILGNIGPRSKSAIPQLIQLLEPGVAEPVREAAAAALGKFGKDARGAVDRLVELAQGGNSLATQAIRALGRIGCADARVRNVLTTLWKGPMQSPVSHLHIAIAICRLGIEADNAVGYVAHHLLNNPESSLRQAAAAALACCGKKTIDVVPALLTAVLSDKDDNVRKSAQAALDQLKLSIDSAVTICAKQLKESTFAETALRKAGQRAVPALIEALDGDDEARLKAARTLAYLGEAAAKAAPALAKALRDKDCNIRLSAAKCLWNITKQSDAVVPTLVRLLEEKNAIKTDDPEVRRQFLQTVMEALWRIGPPARAALPALQNKLKDPNRLIRESAQDAIRKIAT